MYIIVSICLLITGFISFLQSIKNPRIFKWFYINDENYNYFINID